MNELFARQANFWLATLLLIAKAAVSVWGGSLLLSKHALS